MEEKKINQKHLEMNKILSAFWEETMGDVYVRVHTILKDSPS